MRTAHDVPKTFDVTKHGEYLGMPRLKEEIYKSYEEIGIDANRLRLDQREAFLNFIDL